MLFTTRTFPADPVYVLGVSESPINVLIILPPLEAAVILPSTSTVILGLVYVPAETPVAINSVGQTVS